MKQNNVLELETKKKRKSKLKNWKISNKNLKLVKIIKLKKDELEN